MVEKQSFSCDKNYILKLILSFVIIAVFWFMPPISPITEVGMKVLGTFIGTVLLLSTVDTIWPVFLSFILLSLTGVMTLNEVIKGSIGNWITSFVIASFILTNTLNESGFTSRLTNNILSLKVSKSSPWAFTFVFYGICYLVGTFMDQVPATAFFLAFANEILATVGYTKEDKYSNVLVMGAVFAVNLGGAATPISHSLAILGMGIYEQTMGISISLLDYMIYAVPTTLVLFIIMCLLIKYVIKPDVGKMSKFDIDDFVKDKKPMDLREKSIVIIFFFTVIMWVLPGLLEVFLGSKNEFILLLKNYSITFWAFVSVIILSVVKVNNKPLINLKEMMDKKLPWATIFFISIGVLLGSALSVKETGINDFVVVKLSPILEHSPELAIVFLFALGTTMLTNISSNVSTITIMTGVALSIATAVPSVNPMALAITTTMAGSLAFVLPSSFAPIAMLHSDENSDSKMVYLYGCIMVLFSGIVATFLGYNLFDLVVK